MSCNKGFILPDALIGLLLLSISASLCWMLVRTSLSIKDLTVRQIDEAEKTYTQAMQEGCTVVCGHEEAE